MTRPLIAGNWKMHKLPSEAVAWLGAFLEALEGIPHAHAEILLNVPATHLPGMAAAARGSAVRLGGQDLSAFDQGAYTGEISGAMLKDAGAGYVIVGHSERRAYHQEDDALVNAKLVAAFRQGLRPILCVGESEDQRDAGVAEAVVLEQLERNLDGIEPPDKDSLVIAYEPIWAIGTGRTATAADAQEMGATIRRAMKDRYPRWGSDLRLLYGGSMKPENAAELLACQDVNGGLIGGASLDVAALLAIVAAAR